MAMLVGATWCIGYLLYGLQRYYSGFGSAGKIGIAATVIAVCIPFILVRLFSGHILFALWHVAMTPVLIWLGQALFVQLTDYAGVSHVDRQRDAIVIALLIFLPVAYYNYRPLLRGMPK